MATARVEITTFRDIVHNLLELAKFDQKNDIQNMHGRKLNIDRNGRFLMTVGEWFRSGDSSLMKSFNRATIENLLKEAIKSLSNQGIQQNPDLRKAIFDGIRGYRWLLSSYRREERGASGSNRDSLESSLNNLDIIQKDFTDQLKAAVNTMDNFHLWFTVAQPELRLQNSGQSVYMDEKALKGNGICGGISTKWLMRWVASGKSSLLDSSKPVDAIQAEFNLKVNSYVRNYKTTKNAKWIGMVAKYGIAAAEFQLLEMAKENLRANRNLKDPRLDRLQKKGSEMYVLQRERDNLKRGGDMQANIQKASVHHQENLEKQLNYGFQAVWASNPRDEAKAMKKFNEARTDYQNMDLAAEKRAGFLSQNPIQDTNQFIDRIASKYANMSSDRYMSHPFRKALYFCDASDFQTLLGPVLLPLISESEVALRKGERIGYGISWRAGALPQSEGYRFGGGQNGSRNIGQEGGHALGFHITTNNTFLVFDPNYGEFGCSTGEEVVQHFSRWFSLYSKDSALVSMGTMKFYQDDLYNQLEREFFTGFSL
ncbi:MAG: hypothetical protein ACKO5E_15585 [bacterium]